VAAGPGSPAAAEGSSIPVVVEPEDSVVLPEGATTALPVAHPVADASIEGVVSEWLLLQAANGPVDRMRDRGSLGESRVDAGPRWPVVRDVPGRVDRDTSGTLPSRRPDRS